MTKAVIIFFISLAVYLVGMGVFGLVKFIKAKRNIKKDEQERKEQEEKKDEK